MAKNISRSRRKIRDGLSNCSSRNCIKKPHETRSYVLPARVNFANKNGNPVVSKGGRIERMGKL